MDAQNVELRAQVDRASAIWWYWLPVVAYAAVIFYVSSLPHPEETFPSFLEDVSDKVLHLIEYGILGILMYRAFRRAAGPWAARHALWLAIVLAVLYGATDEVHQAFVPAREADLWDVVADAVGVGLLTGGWHLLVRDKVREARE